MTVLVVEDQPNLAEPLQDQLEAMGHGCLTACDVDEAEWMLESVDVDVLVLDLDIPEVRPLEWLEELCLATPDRANSTVAITGRALGAEDVLTIQALGATLLRKPFPIQKLHAAVLEHLGSGGEADVIVDTAQWSEAAPDERDEV